MRYEKPCTDDQDLVRKLTAQWLHKKLAFLSKLLSFGFHPSLFTLTAIFVSGRCTYAFADVYINIPKSIHNGVLQGSILSLTLFPLFIHDLSPSLRGILYYAYDSALHHFISSKASMPIQDMYNSKLEATESLTSDFSFILQLGKRT